jgi:ATPase subunit of ABC transporter with duplicated ATPase domains
MFNINIVSNIISLFFLKTRCKKNCLVNVDSHPIKTFGRRLLENILFMHIPVFLNDIGLSFPNKICFEHFSAQIQPGSRIAVIGNNGSGKSTLLKIIKGDYAGYEGEILNNEKIIFGYVPQIIKDYDNLSGGEKFNKALSLALGKHPDILLLDEPTNHLDRKNRQSLMKMANFYKGTLIIVSHDSELLRSCIDTIWRIDNAFIDVFNGKYDDYMKSLFHERQAVEDELHSLNKNKKSAHKALMKEQERAAKSKQRGEKLVEQKRWLPAVGDLKQSSAEKASGKNKAALNLQRAELNNRLTSLRLPEIIKPKFSLNAKENSGKTVMSISGGAVKYPDSNEFVLENITLSIDGGQRAAVTGDNGSGKSTLFKAILQQSANKSKKEIQETDNLIICGQWDIVSIEDIGYLDQHYQVSDETKTLLEAVSCAMPQKTRVEIRDFLNDFLFRKNEDVNKKICFLSGGERARLALALIAAKTPRLLLLDEITNNIDLETKNHCAQVLKDYPGAIIIISHENDFLESAQINSFYDIKK